jgi:hypothetical protein
VEVAEMPRQIQLPGPSKVAVTFVVAAPEHPLQEPEEEVRRCWAGLPWLTDRDAVEVRVEQVSSQDPEVAWAFQVLGCPDCSPDVDPLVPLLLKSADAHLAVTCTAPPGWRPSHLPACAHAVDALAERTGGMRFDPDRVRLLPGPWRPEPWETPDRFAVMPWIRVSVAREGAGHVMDTTGLDRLGLPELRATRLAKEHVHGWYHLFAGLAQVLARHTFTTGERTLPVRLTVTRADVAAAEGRQSLAPAAGAEATVRLRHAAPGRHGGLGRLDVLPPEEHRGHEREWRTAVVHALCD